MNITSAAKAVFLDRDGVINRRPAEGLYITSPEELVLLPGVAAAIQRLNENGYLVFVATNQRCIARGSVSAETVGRIHERMTQEIAAGGGHIERVYFCPHGYGDSCECRKPRPGMLRQAAQEHALDLANCWMVGDNISDVEAGCAAACRTVLVGEENFATADFVAGNLTEAVNTILTES